MKLYYLAAIMVAAMFTSCKKESALTPSLIEKNFYVIKDDPSDATTHAIYQFYTATNIPVFLKDTIGTSTRVDPFGLTYIYSEVLKVNYNPNGTTVNYVAGNVTYTDLTVKTNTIAALNFLTANVVPVLPKGIAPQSFLLTDTLYSAAYGTDAYSGYNTVVLGSVPRIASFNAARLNNYKAAVLRAIVAPYVLDAKYISSLNTNFYAVSRAFVTNGQDVYGLTLTNILSFQGKSSSSVTPANGVAYLQSMGFLGKDPSINDNGRPALYNIAAPPTYLDVSMYIEAIFKYNTAQFTALYGNNIPIMKKYNAMKALLVTLGFTVI